MYTPTKEIEGALDIIKHSNFFKNYGMSGRILCGSSTYTYPIEHWVERKEIVVHTERGGGRDFRGIKQSAKAMLKSLAERLPIKDWYFARDNYQLRIYYN